MHGWLSRERKWRACDVEEEKWELILQPFRHFTYATVHSPSLPSLYLRHSSFSNSSDASPTSQLILQPSYLFFYVTHSSLMSPGEPPMEIWILMMKIKLVVTPQWKKSPLSLSQKWRRRLHQCRQHHNISCARERVNTFSVPLENFVSSCSSYTVGEFGGIWARGEYGQN